MLWLNLFLFAAIWQVSPGHARNRLMETDGMYQGDIQLTPDQWEKVNKGENAFGSIRSRRWPGGKIPYVIESSIRNKNEIEKAIADYHKYTCLRFVKRTNERNYISFYNGKGCNSPVGMYGHNRISLEYPGCQNKGTIMHEIGHSIGLEHEQCRPDRDGYVTIHYENLENPRWKFAFDKARDIDSLGTKYDLASMMHYSSTAFAKRGTKTITTNDPSKQRLIDTYNRITGFSEIDKKQINLMYEQECKRGTGGNTCRDTNSNCASWARARYCTDPRYKTTVLRQCCQSCRRYGK